MAIAPPSDLILDVARAADPAKVREATARLARLAADPSAANDGFGQALAAAREQPAAASRRDADGPHAAPTQFRSATGKTDVYRKFEAAMLTTFVEAMLPKDDQTFGDKASAGIYRSMMAEQLADKIASSGGIGIAKALAKAHPIPDAKPHQTFAAPSVAVTKGAA